MIAFRTDIKDIESKRLTARKGAELVAFEFTLHGKKFVFCTVYRVNNLGKINHESIMNTIKTYYKDRNPRKILTVGDFNLSGVSWPISANQDISRGIEKPTITIKSTFSSPWFDSECYEAYRDKKGHISHVLRVLIMK